MTKNQPKKTSETGVKYWRGRGSLTALNLTFQQKTAFHTHS